MQENVIVRSWLALPALTTVTAVLYGSGALLLLAGAVTWVPGKNPRWVITGLAVVAAVMFVWTVARGRRFTATEALVMVAVEFFTIGALTWSTDLELGAYANGTVLPVAGVYVIWFLHPVAGRVVVYLGCVWWLVAIWHHDDFGLGGFALSLVAQTIIAAEVFARIKLRLDRLARTDQLTNTLNRRGIAEILDRELSAAVRRGRDLAVVAIDLDGLRLVNNTHGHTAGDQLLSRATRHWSGGLRRRDSIGRTGGDEFLFVLPGTTMEEAAQVVEDLATGSPDAWSAGVAMAKPGDTVDDLLERADRRMYLNKASRTGSDVPFVRRGPSVHS